MSHQSILRNQVTLGLSNIDELRSTADRMEAQLQPVLREFVMNRDIIPLAERFECWSRHCVKKYMGNITGSGDSLIDRMVKADCPMCYETRGMDYAWDHFILHFEEDEEVKQTGGWCNNHLKQFDLTLDDFKEFLIAENFGHFTWDW